MPDAPTRRRVWLTFPTRATVEQPILCRLARELPGIEFDVRQAAVRDEGAVMALLLSGRPDEVEAAVTFLRDQGVRVDPIEKTVIEG